MHRVAVCLLMLVSGCDRLLGLQHIGPGAGGEVIDAPMADSGTCYGHNGSGGAGLLSVCIGSDPQPSLDLAGTINTSSGCDLVIQQSDATHTEVCVLAARMITIEDVVVTGTRPLALLGTESVTVMASKTLDASSHHASSAGPGAKIGPCALGAPPGSATNGGGGGGGGSFGSAGGIGGSGASISGGGVGGAFPVPSVVRAGCGGSTGGSGANSAAGGTGGYGGGGIYIVSGGSIFVRGTINVSGGGGQGGAAGGANNTGGGGGGGGGAGGLVGFDAPQVALEQGAVVFANGGGGGGAGGDTTGGGLGQDPTTALSVAAGAASVAYGGSGGNGFASTTQAAPGGSSKAGGGGGGGGGYVLVYSPAFTTQAQSSPSPLQP